MTFHQNDLIPWHFAEVVTAIRGDRSHNALQRERVRRRHQAARANQRRFWRRYRVISGNVIAFRIRFGGMPPLRAISTPQCMWSSSGTEWRQG